MTENKYEQYLIRNPWIVGINPEVLEPIINFEGEKAGDGVNFTLSRSWITQPFTMIKEPHEHDFDQILFFLGGNPLDVKEFEAEVEFYMGDKQEKYIITTPTVIHVPIGLSHGPLNFRRIDKPIEFLDIFLAPKYIRKPNPE